MAENPATGIARGFAANASDEKLLRAAGVTKPIFRGDKGEVPGKFKMRRGELLGVVRGLRAFGENRQDWTRAEELVHSWGAVIVDLDTGQRSDRHGAKMFDYALKPRRPSAEYVAMQKAQVEARTKGRMLFSKAQKIWFNKKMSLVEKLDLMDGWSKNAAYKAFGKTKLPEGRRPK